MHMLNRKTSTASGIRNITGATHRSNIIKRCIMASAVTTLDAGALRVYDIANLSPQEMKSVLARPRIDFTSILSTVSLIIAAGKTRPSRNMVHGYAFQVAPIVDEVRKEGDVAVKRFTEKFDRVKLDSVCVRIEVWLHAWGLPQYRSAARYSHVLQNQRYAQ